MRRWLLATTAAVALSTAASTVSAQDVSSSPGCAFSSVAGGCVQGNGGTIGGSVTVVPGYLSTTRGLAVGMTQNTPVAAAVGTIPLYLSSAFNGTWPPATPPIEHYVIINDASVQNGASPYGFRIDHNINTGFDGGRISFGVNAIIRAAPLTNAQSAQWQASLFNVQSAVNVGGTALTNGNAQGYEYAINPQCQLTGVATFWQGLQCGETDVVVATGASVFHKMGQYVTLTGSDAVQAVHTGPTAGEGTDYAWGATAQNGSSVGWRNIYSWGYTGGTTGVLVDPTNGSIIAPTPSIYNAASGAKFATPISKNGLDFGAWDVQSTGYQLQTPGFQVGPDGSLYIGAAKLSYVPGTGILTIATPGSCVTTATVDAASSPNTGNFVGDYLFDRTNNGQYKVATVDGSGKVLTVTINRASCVQSGPPATQAVWGGSGGGQGIILDLTWTAGAGLSLPSSKQTISWSSASIAGNSTQFSVPGGLGANQNTGALVSLAGTFRNLYIRAPIPPGAGQTFIATLFVGTPGGESSTTVTCTISGASATTCNDTTHTAAITAGQAWAVQVVTSAASGATGTMMLAAEMDNP